MKIWINRAGQNLGTFTVEEVQRGLNQGQYVPTDLGWQEGMASWKPLAEFASLADADPAGTIHAACSDLSPVAQTSRLLWVRTR